MEKKKKKNVISCTCDGTEKSHFVCDRSHHFTHIQIYVFLYVYISSLYVYRKCIYRDTVKKERNKCLVNSLSLQMNQT